MCGKEMDSVAHWVAGQPIGPKCYAKRFGTMPRIFSKVVENDQPDLFGDDDDTTGQTQAPDAA